MSIAELDMTNSSIQCPSGLRQRTDSNIRTCTRNSNSGRCSSVTLFTSNIYYSIVYGIKMHLALILKMLRVTTWMVLVSLMEKDQDNISGYLLQPEMKVNLVHMLNVPVLT